MTAVLLSASIPSDDERGAAVEPYFPADITAAAASVIEAVLRSGAELVFGGHPTISPIVLQIAGLLRAGPQVHIWQSEHFAGTITPEVRRLVAEQSADMHMIPSVPGVAGASDRTASLEALRAEMLKGHTLAAAFFIGGMEGIRDELQLLAQHTPPVPFFTFVTPGGMAARLAAERDLPPAPLSPRDVGDRGRVLVGRHYGSLALSALDEVDLRPQPRPDEI